MSLLNVGLNADISLGSELGGTSALSSYESGFNDALALAGIGGGIGNYGGAESAGLFQSVAGSFQEPPLSQSQTLQTAQNLLQQAQATSDPVEAQQLVQAARDLLNGSSAGGGYTAVGAGSTGGLSCNGDTVNTGRYTITSTNQNGGTTTIKDNETGVTDTIYGDPHLSSSNGQAGEFQNGPLTIQLADGTDVEIVPTAKNANGVATTSQVVVTRGNGAVILNGQQSSSGVTSTMLDGGGPIMANNFPAGTVLTQGNDGTLTTTNAYGQSTGQAIGDNPSTDLDNLGGGLASQSGFSPVSLPSFGGTGIAGAGGGSNSMMGMLQEILQIVEQIAGNQGLSGVGGAGAGSSDPMSQIMGMLQQILQNTEGGGASAHPQQSSGGGSSTMSEIGSIVSTVLPIALAFL